ncbi:MAG: nucleotidyltransferase domain-containing protein [Candidatus Lokiarchaeia archaeon]
MDIDLKFITNEYYSKKIGKYLNQLFQINKKVIGLILFGSLARGDATYSEERKSDIDLIIIFRDNELPVHHKKRSEIKFKLMELAPSGVDSLWMTEGEFINLVKIKTDIILYALDEGRILYDPVGLIKKQKYNLFKELKKKGVKKEKHYWSWPIKSFGEEIEW